MPVAEEKNKRMLTWRWPWIVCGHAHSLWWPHFPRACLFSRDCSTSTQF